MDEFTFSDQPEPHAARTQRILKDHPSVRRLIGKNPYSLAIIVFLVGLQIVLGVTFSRHGSWALMLLTAYTLGAVANHALFVMIHEATHNLICKKRIHNILAGIAANLPLVSPCSVPFTKYHLNHHAFQGVYALDADIPSRWEARLIGNIWWRKALWLALYPIVQGLRPLRLKELNMWDRWMVLNTVVQFGFDFIYCKHFGGMALGYLTASLFFSIGLHPLGARWIQRHYLMEGTQETHSYYGPLNWVAFNVGYHNEHHDFPSVPWNHLPQLKSEAPEAYEGLQNHTSWVRLLYRWIFDPQLTLYSRVVRQDRGKVALNSVGVGLP